MKNKIEVMNLVSDIQLGLRIAECAENEIKELCTQFGRGEIDWESFWTKLFELRANYNEGKKRLIRSAENIVKQGDI